MDLSTMKFSVENPEVKAGQVELVRQDVNVTTEVHPPVHPTNSSCVLVSANTGVSDQLAMNLAKALQHAVHGSSPMPSIDGRPVDAELKVTSGINPAAPTDTSLHACRRGGAPCRTEMRILMLGKTELRIFMLGKTETRILMSGKTDWWRWEGCCSCD